MKYLIKILTVIVILCVLLVITIKLIYGGGKVDFPDLSSQPIYPESKLEVVANLDTPPGNIAVTDKGRVFVSLHPEAKPDLTLVEIVNGKPVAWPNVESHKKMGRVLGIRIDQFNHLWALDSGNHGVKTPKLTAWDLSTGKLVKQIDFDRSISGLGSDYNDFQISADGQKIYIVDTSIFRLKPGIIVVDVKTGESRRVLHNDPSVKPEKYIPVVQGRKMEIYGIFAIRPGVDSVTLSRDGQWLYYAPITSRHLFRVSTAALNNKNLTEQQLSAMVQTLPPKTMSEGISSDDQGRIYITDAQNSALNRYDPETGRIETLFKTNKLRFPDGLSFGPEGWLYITASSLNVVIGKPKSDIAKHAPYQVFRVKLDATAAAGQ